MTRSLPLLSLLVAASLSLTGGCDKSNPSGSKPGTEPPTATAAGARSYQESRDTSSSAPPASPRRFGEERAGAHILIAYKGALRARPSVTRSKAEARAKAAELVATLKQHPERFAELAKKFSDGPTGPRGGYLGTWRRGRMVPAFDKALDTLKPGQIAGPVETRFGFHVIKRVETRYAGRHILVAYKGAARAKPSVTRSKDEARTLAKELAQKAQKHPEQFAELAKKHSDGPSGPRGGSLGVWKPGRMVPAFQAAVERLPIGGVTAEPVETPFGFHVIKREDPKSFGR